MPKAEYYVARITKGVHVGTSAGKSFFSVTKFEGDEPSGQYLVVWHHAKDEMHCECPNKRRSAHIDDKHGVLVREWLAAGEPQHAMSATPQSRSRPQPRPDAMDEGPSEDDIPF